MTAVLVAPEGFTFQTFYVLHSAQQNGSWRGIEKCMAASPAFLAAPTQHAGTVLYATVDEANAAIAFLGASAYFHPWPVVVLVPDVGRTYIEAFAPCATREAPPPLTASERARQINTGSGEVEDGGAFRLVEDAEFWAAAGVHTGVELERYLLESEYSDVHKEVRGFRPHADVAAWSNNELRAAIATLLGGA